MDSKFYVSYKVARLLKEKGYTKALEDFDFVYLKDASLSPRVFLHTSPFIAAPTKAEAIDWLDTKEIVIEISSVRNRKWRFSIYKNGWFQIDSWIHDRLDFSTRLEAEEAAIIRACELL